MTTFVVIYRGHTIADARLLALSADPALVADVTARILQERSAEEVGSCYWIAGEGSPRGLTAGSARG